MLRRVITAAALLLATSLSALAGKPPVYVTGSVTMSSAYLWRGDRVCGLHFKPDVVLHVGNLALEQYSFLALDGSYKEIDWDLFYTFGPFSVHVADYYARYSDYITEENFFSWRKGATNHIDEVAFTYSCPSFPLNVKWFTFFWETGSQTMTELPVLCPCRHIWNLPPTTVLRSTVQSALTLESVCSEEPIQVIQRRLCPSIWS